MKTLPEIIRESTEYVCAEIGCGAPDHRVLRFAPVTRFDGMVWVHPMHAKSASLDDMRARASAIWKVTDFWSLNEWRLIHVGNPAVVSAWVEFRNAMEREKIGK